LKIESEDKKSSIQIGFIESELEHFPSFLVSIKAENEGFCGSNNVWFQLDQYKSFIDELKILEDKRQGKASLESMSPGEFKVIIESFDSSGHLILRYQISKNVPQTNQIQIIFFVSGGFELDSSCFAFVVKGFESLFVG
jgi:hypothetical protein